MGVRSGLVSSQGRVRPDLVIHEHWGVGRDRSILGFGESQLFEAPISLFSTAPVCTDFADEIGRASCRERVCAIV